MDKNSKTDNPSLKTKKKTSNCEVPAKKKSDLSLKILPKNRNCDCLRIKCPGCFYPCEKCGSHKCGEFCRVGRSWKFDRVIIDDGRV